MRKSFSCAVYCVLILVTLYFYNSWTFLCIFIFIFLVVYALIQFDSSDRTRIKKPGTITHSQCYVTSYKVIKSFDNRHSSKLECFKRDLNSSESDLIFKRPSTKVQRSLPVKLKPSVAQCSQTDMSFLKSNSSSSVGLFGSSPLRRRPLHSRNRIEDSVDTSSISPIDGASVRNVSSGDSGMVTPRRSTLASDSASPNDSMSVGEFPLISLVSSLHEAVSPKTPKLIPSPVTIRIQPIHSPEPVSESRVDPVVSVLKQLANKKRILAPSSSNTLIEEEQKEKKSRPMPRHDLTHSLLESQLTINSNRETINSKREREESYCPVSSPNSNPSGSAPKRMCARTLRSNEILSSLSSSVTLASPTPNKSFTGKRKNTCFDKYKKMRKLEETMRQVNPEIVSPSKIDKAVSAEEKVPEKRSPSVPVITIKRDEISERVVSRAMVSALLKSTVAKLIMSGDPAVYPVPNGSQQRQPEVTVQEFGPPKSDVADKPTSVSSSTGLLSDVSSNPPPSFMFNLPKTSSSLQLPVATTSSIQQPPSFNFGQQTSGASLPTSQTLTSSVQSPSSTTKSNVQTSFSITKPQMSVSSVPSFGQSVSTTSLITPTTSSAVQFGVSTSGATVPTFGLPSTTPSVSTTSSVTPTLNSSTLSSSVKVPSFNLPSTTTLGAVAKTSAPTFGLASNSNVTTTSSAPLFSFGSSTAPKVTVQSVQPPSFSSIPTTSSIAGSPVTTSSIIAPSNNMFLAKPITSMSTPVFGARTVPLLPTTTSSSIFSTSSIQAPTTATTTTSQTLTPSSAPVFGSNAATTSSSNPIFGGNKLLFGTATTSSTTSTPIFGSTINTSTSNNLFGGIQPTTSAPIFGATTKPVTAAPLFGSNTVTTTTSTPIFGNFTSTNPVTASSSIFGGSSALNTSTTLFGGNTPSAPNPLFNMNTASTTTGSSTIFGTSSNASAPIFGSTATTTTTSTPLFGASTSSTTSATPLFGGTAVTTAAPAPIFGTSSTSFTGTSGFGGSSTGKPTEGLFGMPSSNSGFKPTTSPFQVGGGDTGSTVTAFGTSPRQSKPFEFGSTKPASGGFTFKAGGGTTPTPFTAQPAAPLSNTSFTPQPPSQTPFSFTAPAAPPNQTTTSPFIFGSAPSSSNAPAAAGAKPFQFGSPSTIAPTPQAFGVGGGAPSAAQPGFGQSFTPTFGQPASGQPPAFGTSPSPTPGAFQFNATTPTTPGATGGLFSIGTGSSTNRSRDRRDRRKRL